MKKRLLLMLTVLMMVSILLIGCGGTAKTDVEPTESTAEETTESTETETTETETTETESTETEMVETTENDVVESEKTVYTYTDLDKTMYAKSSVNVRSLPSTDGEKLGGLSSGQEVHITGQCNETSWYRVSYNGRVAYVSNNYLVDEKPAEKEITASQNSQQSSNSGKLNIAPGWVLREDGIYYPEDIMPGGANYDEEFHSKWDGKTCGEYYASENARIGGVTPEGTLAVIPDDYVIGSYEIYSYTSGYTGEKIYFCMGL